MNKAETVASLFGTGDVYETEDGRHLEDVCIEHGATIETDDDSRRYVFGDGSAIVDMHGNAWDIEGSTPWSWAGAE